VQNLIDLVQRQLAALQANHPVIFWAAVFVVAVPLLNTAIYFFTSPRWEQIQKDNPRLAMVLRLLDALGMTPPKVLKRIYQIVTGSEWTPPPPPSPSGKVQIKIVPEKPASEAKRVGVAWAIVPASISALLTFLAIGACIPAKTQQDAATLAVCIIDHEGLPVGDIMKACEVQTAQVVIDVITAHKVAAAKAKAAACPTSSSSSVKP